MKKSVRICCMAIFFLWAVSPAFGQERIITDQQLCFGGLVTDLSGTAIQIARVTVQFNRIHPPVMADDRLRQVTAMVNAEGRFILGWVPAVSYYDLIVSASGFIELRKKIYLTNEHAFGSIVLINLGTLKMERKVQLTKPEIRTATFQQ